MDHVKLGIDNIDEYIELFKGKKVGLITNPTGVNSKLESTIDILNERTNLTALFSPEHGIRGEMQAGSKVDNYIDKKTGVKVYSLYGSSKKMPLNYLEDVDILAIDIQDVGARFYTYIYTMAYAMQACSKLNKTFVVFDRPNPIGGEKVEGNILNMEYKSFIGLYPIPQRHGLTIGEIAKMFNEEFEINCNLKIVKMKNWKRSMYFDETGLLWVSPSPNIPTLDTAVVYPGTQIFEGTNISEGRGTTKPFEYIGAPWLNAYELAYKMNKYNLKGVKFRPIYFVPYFSKYKGEICKGVQIHITDKKIFNSVETGIILFYEIREKSGDKLEYIKYNKYFIDLSTGDSYVRDKKYNLKEVTDRFSKEADIFKKEKQKYHIYQ